MKHKQMGRIFNPFSKKQRGASLVEIIGYLGLAGLVIAGALAMFTSGASSQSGNQIVADVSGVRTGVRTLWNSSPNYGAVNMLAALNSAGRLPTTWSTAGAAAAMTANHNLNGAVGIIGQTAAFAITLDNIAPSACVSFLSQQGNQGWTTVYSGAAAGNVTPLAAGAVAAFTPVALQATCAATNRKITLVSN
jgi:hypothetical protein